MIDIKDSKSVSIERDIIVWGLGSMYDKYNHLIDHSKVIMYIDSDYKKVGELKNGIKIVHPNELENVNFNNVILIIASSYKDEIESIAISIGFNKEQIYDISSINILKFHNFEYLKSNKLNNIDLIKIPSDNVKFLPERSNYHILNSIAVNQDYYESDVLKSSLKYINTNNHGIIIDVGANIGNHAFFWHQKTSKKIFCFEGDPLNFSILKSNISLNKFNERITIHNLCVSKESGEKYIFKALNDINHGANIAIPTHSSVDSTRSIKLDDYPFEDKVELIKIDVEGMEPDVISGSKKIIEIHSPVIIFEAHTEEHKVKCLAEIPNYVIAEEFLQRTPTYIAIKSAHQ